MIRTSLRSLTRVAGMTSLALLLAGSVAFAENRETLDDMQTLIKKQQEQLDAQAKELDTLSKKVDAMAGTDGAASSDTALKDAVSKHFKLYGQVNRALLYSGDGDRDYVYQVDNSNSSTRFGIDAKTEKNGLTTGAKIEVELQSNASSKVNQNDRRSVGDGHFQKRHMDVFVSSAKLGKLSVGHGSTASDGTSEVDLSGTNVVSYSSVSSMAGGQYFYDDNTDALDTASTIGSVMNNMDGLGRDDRLRYDSPNCHGLGLSASYIANGGGDAAVKYTMGNDTLKLSAALAYANPGSTSGSVDDQVNGSVSVLHTSGANLTLAGGSQGYKTSGRDDGSFFYGKIGCKKNVCPAGTTAFSIDYGTFSDLAANGDTAETIGAAMVQNLTDWSTEVYLCYRFHTLDRNGSDYKDINSVMGGLRVKF